MADTSDTSQQIKLLIIGALVGFIPSVLLAGLQYRQQTHQFLLDRGMTAMKDFSSALNASDLLQKLNDKDVAVYGWSLDPLSKQHAEEVYEADRSVYVAYKQYFERVRTASIMMDIVFHTKLPVLSSPYVPRKMALGDVPRSRKDIIQLCQREVDLDEELRAEIAHYGETDQGALEELASKMK